jgi:hypothetical protein
MAADVGKSTNLAIVAANDDHALAEIFHRAPLARLGDLALMANHLRRSAQERPLLGREELRIMIEPAREADVLQRVRGGLN